MPDISVGHQLGDTGRIPHGCGAGYEYVFGPRSPLDQIFSRRIVLPEGFLHFFRVHNIEPGRRVFMNLVTVATDADFMCGIDTHVQRMTLGDPERWILSLQRPQMLVNLPGIYRFELENPDMLGADLVLEYSSVRCVPDVPPGVVL